MTVNEFKRRLTVMHNRWKVLETPARLGFYGSIEIAVRGNASELNELLKLIMPARVKWSIRKLKWWECWFKKTQWNYGG